MVRAEQVDDMQVGDVQGAKADAVTWRFALPRDASALRLCSGAARPAAVRAGEEDRRMLGLGVPALATVDARGARRAIAMDHPDLRLGWHGVEDAAGTPWRWTDGAAVLPPSLLRGAVAIEVTVAHRMPAWRLPEMARERRAAG